FCISISNRFCASSLSNDASSINAPSRPEEPFAADLSLERASRAIEDTRSLLDSFEELLSKELNELAEELVSSELLGWRDDLGGVRERPGDLSRSRLWCL
uniref:Vps53_N domain-containing protein n=1 Tax=Rodentolepis nana TaxID=102285 RepID=A0A0R3TGM1_RODNA